MIANAALALAITYLLMVCHVVFALPSCTHCEHCKPNFAGQLCCDMKVDNVFGDPEPCLLARLSVSCLVNARRRRSR